MRFLHVINGPDRGASFVLADMEPQLIGRSTEALALTDSTISRRHAELTPGSEGWYLRDLDSSHGTLLNGTLLTGRSLLKRGDRITCGSTDLLFDRNPEDQRPVEAVTPEEATLELIDAATFEGSDAKADRTTSEQFSVLLRATELAVGESDMRVYVESFLQLLMEAVSARKAMAIIFGMDAAGTAWITAAAEEDGPIRINEQLIEQARKQTAVIRAWESERGNDRRRALMAVPLQTNGTLRGVALLELEELADKPEETRAQDTLLHALGGQAGMALDRCMMMDELLSRSRLAAMGETVAAISHGVKNILQGLRGGTDAVAMAIERGDLELAGRGWGVLARNLERIQSLTMNMLGFVRNQELELETISLEHLSREAIELLQTASNRAGVTIQCRFPDDLPPIPLDSTSILQLLLNLLSNAIDASPHGSSVVLSGAFMENEARVRLEITDQGPGIGEGIQDRLFEPFTTSKGQRGTGLGLVVSRKIAQRHEGTLECVSTGSLGTTMRLELPSDLAARDPGDTDAPKGISGEDLDIEFGPPEH